MGLPSAAAGPATPSPLGDLLALFSPQVQAGVQEQVALSTRRSGG